MFFFQKDQQYCQTIFQKQTKRKRDNSNKIIDEKGAITMDFSEIQNIIREYFEKPYSINWRITAKIVCISKCIQI